VSEYQRSWAFGSPERFLKFIDNTKFWDIAEDLDAEVTLLIAISQAAIVAPLDVTAPGRSKDHAGGMNRSADLKNQLKKWLRKEITADTLDDKNLKIFSEIGHTEIPQGRLFNDQGKTVDVWFPRENIEPLTEKEKPWKLRELYTQIRHALSHSMVFMKGRESITEIVLCPLVDEDQNPTWKKYQVAKVDYDKWKNSTLESTEEMEEPEEPENLCDCLVFPIDTYKEILRFWLLHFAEYGSQVGILSDREVFDEAYFEAA
jgi:hypothetical protein